MIDLSNLWVIIFALGIGSFVLRFTFLGLVGNRPLPAWLMRHLRYTAVAILPALIAPAILWPPATGGDTDPARLAAAAMTLGIGMWTKNINYAIVAGGLTLYGVQFLLG